MKFVAEELKKLLDLFDNHQPTRAELLAQGLNVIEAVLDEADRRAYCRRTIR